MLNPIKLDTSGIAGWLPTSCGLKRPVCPDEIRVGNQLKEGRPSTGGVREGAGAPRDLEVEPVEPVGQGREAALKYGLKRPGHVKEKPRQLLFRGHHT